MENDLIKNIKKSRTSLCEKIIYDIFDEIKIYNTDVYTYFYIKDDRALFSYDKIKNIIFITEEINTFFGSFITSDYENFEHIVFKYIKSKIKTIDLNTKIECSFNSIFK